ncbi:hypothetical protein AWM75_02620 [Aerococcus urinaehominis]|uniref:biotin--[biotin carboxyl-carrier protein] ligase n=1 Tax=Aerococcus urinaehominis TaxID=128944 RepID=A0A0X8FKE9_9LACT|nr:biotin--[acetyl-CoA-carboxylase] ligase [Aerococcus urinaehominis]AMB98956.1 hypothetical protein AWM75_02620 [Aerococcus urinaehominis]SDM41205.1 BirA family transcriptional regulator, biotin operon repressor / biotin-[acetyl-CoA-carboxylase] ligase [Aerococcus urinaehominis]
MNLASQILTILMDQPGETLSGQRLADTFAVSRNAIWKTIKQLNQEGYQITSQGRSGYQLEKLYQRADSRQLQALLCHEPALPAIHIAVHDQVTSTNDLAKQFLIDHPQDIGLFISHQQTAGRGRQGRPFNSNLSHGLYFSLAFGPKQADPQLISLYTIAAATACCQALAPYLDQELKIKWVNDLFYQKRKVAGILCEGITDLENMRVSGLLVGIGLNLAGDFSQADPAIQKVAGTLFGHHLPDNFNENQFLASFLVYFYQYHKELAKKAFIPYYSDHLLGRGQRVSYQSAGQEEQGVILGINDMGHLLIDQGQGEVKELMSGEVHFGSQQFTS